MEDFWNRPHDDTSKTIRMNPVKFFITFAFKFGININKFLQPGTARAFYLYFYTMKGLVMESLDIAAGDYLWMLSRGYPQKSSLKLVGDKFMLSREMRQILYRGISDVKSAAARREKLGSVAPGDRVLVDTYNVLFTVNNYLLGKYVFICNDGMLRDAGEMRGRIVSKPVFKKSVTLFLGLLVEYHDTIFDLFLDEPVSYSGLLAAELTGEMDRLGIRGRATTVRSPDQVLVQEKGDAVCTSDTVIIDQFQGKVVDLPLQLLQKEFKPQFFSLLK